MQNLDKEILVNFIKLNKSDFKEFVDRTRNSKNETLLEIIVLYKEGKIEETKRNLKSLLTYEDLHPTYKFFVFIIQLKLMAKKMDYQGRETIVDSIEEIIDYEDSQSMIFLRGLYYESMAIVCKDEGKFDDSIKMIELGLLEFGKVIELENSVLVWNFYNLYGICFARTGKLEEAGEYFQKCINILKNRDRPGSLAHAYGNLAVIHRMKGRLDTSLKLQTKSLQLKLEIKDYVEAAKSYINIGVIENNRANYQEGKNFIEEGMKLFHQADALILHDLARLNLGNSYFGLGDLITAEFHFKKALDAIDDIHIDFRAALILGNLADITFIKGDLKKTIHLIDQSFEIHQSINNKVGMGLDLCSLGMTHTLLGHEQQAESALERSYAIRKKLGSDRDLAQTLLSFIRFGLIFQKPGVIELRLKQINGLASAKDNSEIRTHQLIANALVAHTYPDLCNKDPEELFTTVINEEINFPMTILAMINLTYLKLIRLDKSNSMAIQNEIHFLISDLYAIASEKNLVSLKIDTRFIETRLKILEFDFEQSLQILRGVKKVVEDDKYHYLLDRFSIEEEYYQLMKDKWLSATIEEYDLELQVQKDLAEFIENKGAKTGTLPYFIS